MSLRYFKSDDEVLDFTIDWSDDLNTGETISTSTWAKADAADAIEIETDSETGTTATVRLSAGVHGYVYRVTNLILTTDGREFERTLRIHMIPR